MNNLIGQTLLNRYRVDSFVSSGGMGAIYKVWDIERAVYLAMQLLHSDLSDDPRFYRMFKREAETLTNFAHPNIARCYGVEKDKDVVFILMQFVEGQSLRSEIHKAGSPFPLERVLQILHPVCSVLQYIHSMGFVHGDLKPSNIIIGDHRQLWVTDLGLARIISKGLESDGILSAGSPGYLAPEQLLGKGLFPQTDIYALGTIIYEMLTGGRRPFIGDSAPIIGSSSERIRYEHLKSQPPSPSQYNPLITPELDKAVIKCLAKEPKERYANAMEVFTAIETAINRKSNLTRGNLFHPQELESYITPTLTRDLRVFLCHSSSDKPSVEKYYNTLISDGIDAWLDKEKLIPGQDWQVEIQKAVRNSDVVIVFLSSSSVTKEGFVQKEIKIALDAADEKPEGTIFIIPAKLETCKVPERLAKFHWVDLFENGGYERLFKALQMRAQNLDIVVNRRSNMLPK